MSEEWPAPPPTLTNMEFMNNAATTAMVGLPTSALADGTNVSITQEEPPLRFAPPVPLPRRSSVDVVGVANKKNPFATFSLKAATLAANQSLLDPAAEPEFLFTLVC